MRYAVLSDVHGNLAALRAAIGMGRREGVDGWLCLGDVIGYGPQPNECVETIAELGAIGVAGNHELLALGELSGERSGVLCRDTTPWTRRTLRADALTYLARLPRLLDLGDVVLAHGSLSDPEQYVRSEADGAEQLRRLAEDHSGAHVLLLGHTHRQWAFSGAMGSAVRIGTTVSMAACGRHLVNPGAVGQSRHRERLPLARFAVLDLDRSEVRYRAVAYDVAASREALQSHRLPRECIHVHPGLVPKVRRRSRRVLRSVLGGTGSPPATPPGRP